ncbi:MAG: cell surface protein SprA [Tannerella sp.]|jgi:cell surface protein SprA|nr:cell surface protein SprA [Tannerella sp.]
MRNRAKHISSLLLLLSMAGFFTLHAGLPRLPQPPVVPAAQDSLTKGDSVQAPRYPVAKTEPETYEDLLKQPPADLKTPENVKSTVEYDTKTGTYVFHTRIGDMDIGTPLMLTPEEYSNYDMQQSLRAYYREKNDEAFKEAQNKKFNPMDMQFDLGPADRIFGKGGVQIRPQGSAELKLGIKHNSTDNPSLPERSRSHSYFDFDQNIQFNVQASVGTKVNFNMNYNTETAFSFDSKNLKLGYTGEEDEIVKDLEAGNVSMSTNNSLINGGAALFGVKTQLQFGKLRINALLAQQKSQTQTVNAKGGVQTKPFEITVDQYDANRHFFLAQYFRDHYDEALKQFPYINSAVTINRVEVWVTNKRSNFNQARNIVAFSDLGEHTHISNPAQVQPLGSLDIPYNKANTLYGRLQSEFSGARDLSKASQVLGGSFTGGRDFEKIENARLLDASEYTVNKQLGYISLNTALQSDEVLAVAFEYQYNGTAYQVGEFSTDNTENTTGALFLKLIKGTALSPQMPYWNLMMKNVYALGAYSIQASNFKLNVLYQNDTTGTYVSYLPDGAIKNQLLLRVLNLDRLNTKQESHPDGIFDFVEGVTVQAANGWIFFPEVEPFGSYLRSKINDPAVADKYVFQELYDSTQTVAQQMAEKNKFELSGEYQASSGAEIQLDATNVAQGSVVVTANGQKLVENVDYVVDYASGVVTILNQSIIASKVPVSVSLENQSTYSMQRKTMAGIDLNYQFNKNFSLGGTLMHLSEMPLTTKTAYGDESVNNTLWGLNTSWKTQSQWLTNLFDKLPLLELTKPSQISLNAEFANLIAGHYQNKYTGKYSYLDDFESTQSSFSLMDPSSWNLASTPYEDTNPKFPEASLSNNIDYGKNRALFAWYVIDPLFTRTSSPLMPNYLKQDKDQLSNQYVRAVQTSELFPNRDLTYTESNVLSVLNVAYYPNTRGPYNLNTADMQPDGTLANPQKHWGGMMRKLDQTDFETANIEYIEFWMLDPYIYKPSSPGGDLYFDLGEISEDVLKDEKKFFENGLPIDGDTTKVDYTVWGKVPNQQSTVYAFDNTAGARALQDVGFNGLSSAEEAKYPTYENYLQKLKGILNPNVFAQFEADPAGDNYHYYRGADLDREKASILDRYKYYNGTEGNSAISGNASYNTASRSTPDVEDFNQDNTMNENESYYQYRVSLRPQDMHVGNDYIVDTRKATVTLANGKQSTVTWYQFKIPIKEYTKKIGSISDFKSIRFMRMYMTDFTDTTILRFGEFELERGDWRTYEQSLAEGAPSNASLDVSAVNIEENGDRKPVNYVLPPGVTRMIDPGQPQLTQENEQSLALKVTNLGPQDARAVYKSSSYDLRQYKRMQLFTHAEALVDDESGTKPADNDLSVFVRLGSDYKNNYYEYDVPMTVTQPRTGTTLLTSDQVWPSNNMMNFRFQVLTDLKLKRNNEKQAGKNGVSYSTVYSSYDPDNTRNKITVVGNPSLSDVKVIMIGVRNNSRETKSAEVWVDEMRLSDFNESGGWAADGTMNVALSDLGTVNLTGRIETAGFGGLDQSLTQRSLDNLKQYAVSANIELGKFFPEKAKVSLPLYYAYSKNITDPKYNPLDQDILLSDAIDKAANRQAKDSIRDLARIQETTRSIALNNVKVDLRSKTPMPYDPANFSFGYAFSESKQQSPDIAYQTTQNYQANFGYTYSPYLPPFKPFKKLKKETGYTRYIQQLAFNYLPSNITFQTNMNRNYTEEQQRDLTDPNPTPELMKNLLTFSDNFVWDRSFGLTWNFTNNLRFSFSSGTNAQIEEPYVQVNKKLDPNDYRLWKDSVLQSIAHLGRPMDYDQRVMLSYNFPFQFIPALNWINSSASYTATYNWDRGAEVDSINVGNTIRNQRQLQWQGSMNFTSLYNKSKRLRDINAKFTSIGRAIQRPAVKKRKPKPIEVSIELSRDSAVIVRHGLMTKRLIIRAHRPDGKTYRKLKYKALDFSRIRIENRDTGRLVLNLQAAPPKEEGVLDKAVERGLYFLMMVKRLSFQYASTDGMMIPGFSPEVGDIFGQGRSAFGLAPGLGFAFGDVRRSYLNELAERNWLVIDQNNVNPAVMSGSSNLNMSMTLEPISGLHINLTALRQTTNNTQIQYMYDGMPELEGGNFQMTTFSLGSFFGGMGNAGNNYASKAFNRFLADRQIIASRLQGRYNGTMYPNSGFLQGSSLAGQAYNPALAGGTVNTNSPDVLIPAFLAAYTGHDPKRIGFSPFPALKSMMPNWNITYDGLIKLAPVKKYFKTLTLSHTYRSQYSVGDYSSVLNWVDAGNGLGFVQDAASGNPVPSSKLSIGSVTLADGFSPLLGIDGTLANNMTLRALYNTTRTLNLNLTSFQMVEALSREITFGLGYKLTEFNKVLKRKATPGFSNDLTLQLNYSYQKMLSVIRKIQDATAQATSGSVSKTVQFTASYNMSKAVTLQAFYDLQINNPLISSASFPTSNANYGISIRLNFTQ